MKRIICLLLVALMVVGIVACGSSVPSDYQKISFEKDPFDLYVPKTWTDNSASGMASAYYSGDKKIMVSGASTHAVQGETLKQYVERIDKEHAEALPKYERKGEIAETTLGGSVAYRLEYFAEVNGELMSFASVFSAYDAYIVNLTYCAISTHYADRLEDFENIISYFTFKQPVITPPVQGEDGEEYVLASHEKNVFNFYVPTTWVVSDANEIAGAYYYSANGDKSNVTLMEYASSYEIKSAKDYWEAFQSQYEKPLEIISTDENAKLGKYDAFGVEYKTSMNDGNYKIKQIFLASEKIIYIFTYTSTDEFYDAHLDEVAKMVEMFEFK